MKRAYLPNLTVTLDDTVAYMRYPDAVTSLARTVSRLIDSYKGNPLGSVYTVMLENHLLTFCQHPYDAQPIELLIDQLVGTSVDDDEGKVDIEWLFSLLCQARPNAIMADIREGRNASPFTGLSADQQKSIVSKIQSLDHGKMRLKQSLPNGSEAKQRCLSIWQQTYDLVRTLASMACVVGVNDLTDLCVAFCANPREANTIYMYSTALLQYGSRETMDVSPIRNSLMKML